MSARDIPQAKDLNLRQRRTTCTGLRPYAAAAEKASLAFFLIGYRNIERIDVLLHRLDAYSYRNAWSGFVRPSKLDCVCGEPSSALVLFFGWRAGIDNLFD